MKAPTQRRKAPARELILEPFDPQLSGQEELSRKLEQLAKKVGLDQVDSETKYRRLALGLLDLAIRYAPGFRQVHEAPREGRPRTRMMAAGMCLHFVNELKRQGRAKTDGQAIEIIKKELKPIGIVRRGKPEPTDWPAASTMRNWLALARRRSAQLASESGPPSLPKNIACLIVSPK